MLIDKFSHIIDLVMNHDIYILLCIVCRNLGVCEFCCSCHLLSALNQLEIDQLNLPRLLQTHELREWKGGHR